jgi:hypothetical protein
MKDLYDEWMNPAPIKENKIPETTSHLLWSSRFRFLNKYQNRFFAVFKSHRRI